MDDRELGLVQAALGEVEDCLRRMDALLDGFDQEAARTMVALRREVSARIATADALVEKHVCAPLRTIGTGQATVLEMAYQDATKRMRSVRVDIQTRWPMSAAVGEPLRYRDAVRSINKPYYDHLHWERTHFLETARRLMGPNRRLG